MGRKSLVICHSDHRFEQSRDAMWRKMVELKEFSPRCISDWCHIHKDTVKSYIKGLLEHGFIESFNHRDKELRYQRRWYRMLRPQRNAPRINKAGDMLHTASVQDNIWRNLPIQKQFSSRDMLMVVNTESCPTTLFTVKSYLSYLHRAGYIALRGKGPSSYWVHLPARWTGPQPPKIMRTHEVWDANQNRVVWSEHQEVACEKS